MAEPLEGGARGVAAASLRRLMLLVLQGLSNLLQVRLGHHQGATANHAGEKEALRFNETCPWDFFPSTPKNSLTRCPRSDLCCHHLEIVKTTFAGSKTTLRGAGPLLVATLPLRLPASFWCIGLSFRAPSQLDTPTFSALQCRLRFSLELCRVRPWWAHLSSTAGEAAFGRAKRPVGRR